MILCLPKLSHLSTPNRNGISTKTSILSPWASLCAVHVYSHVATPTHRPFQTMTHTSLREGKPFLITWKRLGEKKFEPLLLACLRKKPDRPNFHDIHDQLMKMKPKIAGFTDPNILRQLFSRFALGITAPKQSSLHLLCQRNTYNGSINCCQRTSVGCFFLLLSRVAAYIVGGLLRSDSILLVH